MLNSQQTVHLMPEQFEQFLRIHHYLPASIANGPGQRIVVWVQGCTLGCPGCFNPATHSVHGGELIKVSDLADRIREDAVTAVEGLTISGGEPLQQRQAVTALLRRIRKETDLTTLLFTGYTWDEILSMPDHEWLDYVDVVIAGRYDPALRLAQGLRGSSNQTVHFLTDCYTEADLAIIPPVEVSVTGNKLVMSGVGPAGMSRLSAMLAEFGIVVE